MTFKRGISPGEALEMGEYALIKKALRRVREIDHDDSLAIRRVEEGIINFRKSEKINYRWIRFYLYSHHIPKSPSKYLRKIFKKAGFDNYIISNYTNYHQSIGTFNINFTLRLKEEYKHLPIA